MRGSENLMIDVGALLEKVEAAAPIDSVQAVASFLGEMVDARKVDLLITFPLRLRNGEAEEVDLRIEPPFGVVPGKAFDVQEFPLEPGDRIVLLTDGMQERNAVNLDVAGALADSADLHPREVVHELGSAILRATGGDLQDDATMVCLDWYGGPPRGRNSEQGADPDRASAPA
jgi:hypothetical protein